MVSKKSPSSTTSKPAAGSDEPTAAEHAHAERANGHEPQSAAETAPRSKHRERRVDRGGAESEKPQGQDEPAPDADEAEDSEPEQPPVPFYKRPVLMTVIVVVSLVLVAGGIIYWLWARQYEWTDDAFVDGHVVRLAPKVSGYVAQLLVTDNEFVTQGQLLLVIDQRDYLVAVEQAKAATASALSRLAEAESQLAAAQAQAQASAADTVAAEAMTRNAQRDLKRYSELAPRGAASQQSLDTAATNADSTSAQEAAARARAGSADSQVHLAQAHRQTAAAEAKEAEARLAEAELNLSYTRIQAPIAGRVTRRTVELGDYLQAGQPLFALVDPNVWVTANFKETQLTHMHVGQPVRLKVDAFPRQELQGHVDSFQRGTGARFSMLPAENATGNYVKVVQRVPVKIVLDAPPPQDMILGPGMSVVPRVTVR